jgi:hypothetical protein
MLRRISLLTVDGLRPSSLAMARMLRRACSRSAIVIRSDSERNRAEITTRPLMRDGSVLLDVSGLQNDRVAVPPSSARTTADSHDPARFGIAHSLFHQLIIVSTCSVLWRGAPGLPRSFHLCQLQLLNRSGVATTTGRQAHEMAHFSTIADTPNCSTSAAVMHLLEENGVELTSYSKAGLS